MLFSLGLFCMLSAAQAVPKCLNHDGNSVDWYFIYKQPDGFSYAYHDADTTATTLAVVDGRTLANTVDNPLGKTLHQVYENKNEYAYALYNDEDPFTKKTFGTGTAHAKGVIAADGTGGGFWLIHSVPKFPDMRTADFKWDASTTYAQSFLCINLDKANIEAAAKQLQYAKVHFFDQNMPSAIIGLLPNMDAAIKGNTLSGANEQSFTSAGGVSFTHFMKAPDWGKDLYADFVQPSLKTDLYVETWRRAPFAPSYCKSDGSHSYNTINVEAMVFGSDKSFPYTHDHSKWAVGTSSSQGYVCVGDINRMKSQRKRGGGTMCFQSTALHTALSNAISKKDSCDGSAASGTVVV